MNYSLLWSKTFWTGVAGVIFAGAGLATGNIEAGQALQIALTSLVGIFVRDGIESSSKKSLLSKKNHTQNREEK
jgi:hypothetical protein